MLLPGRGYRKLIKRTSFLCASNICTKFPFDSIELPPLILGILTLVLSSFFVLYVNVCRRVQHGTYHNEIIELQMFICCIWSNFLQICSPAGMVRNNACLPAGNPCSEKHNWWVCVCVPTSESVRGWRRAFNSLRADHSVKYYFYIFIFSEKTIQATSLMTCGKKNLWILYHIFYISFLRQFTSFHFPNSHQHPKKHNY